MNFYVVVHEFPCDGSAFHGGIATFYMNLSKVLKNNGNYVSVITLSDKYNDATKWNDIEVNRVKVPKCIYSLSRKLRTKTIEYFASSFLIRLRINKCLKCVKPDIIQYANFKGLSYFRPNKIPCVVRMSSDNVLWRETYKENYDYQTAKNKFISEDRFEIKAINKADAIFAPSHLIAQITAERTGKKVTTIESLYSAVIEDNSVFLKSEIKDKRYMLFFGAVCPMKGCLVIGDVLSDFFDQYPDMFFVFIGHDYHVYKNDGTKSLSTKEYIKGLNPKYENNIVFFDSMEREFIVPFIKNAEACVFPSRIDNIPNTCLEAMYEKKVVIGTSGASFDQIIVDGESGILISIDNRNELLSAMMKVMEMTGDEKTAMGRAAYNRIMECSEQKVYQKMMDFYKCCIR